MSEIDLTPKQKRSEITLGKIILAIKSLVETKYFEHITIADIAKHAGISVGTFYRRFKDKESALPVLYQSFQEGLREWINSNEQHWRSMETKELLESLTRGNFNFFITQKGVVRTLHIYARLRPDLIDSKRIAQRKDDYSILADFIAADLVEKNQFSKNVAKEKALFVIFTIVSLTLEKAVYSDLTPAIATPQQGEKAINEIVSLANSYLKN